MPVGAGGCVDTFSLLMSVNAYTDSRPWPSGVVIGVDDTNVTPSPRTEAILRACASDNGSNVDPRPPPSADNCFSCATACVVSSMLWVIVPLPPPSTFRMVVMLKQPAQLSAPVT